LFGGVYKDYTGGSMTVMLENLARLKEVVKAERVLVKIPVIPKFTVRSDVEICADRLRKMGYPNVRIIDYIEKPSCLTT
jgi:pyruvate-formate lyase-activating enzyme